RMAIRHRNQYAQHVNSKLPPQIKLPKTRTSTLYDIQHRTQEREVFGHLVVLSESRSAGTSKSRENLMCRVGVALTVWCTVVGPTIEANFNSSQPCHNNDRQEVSAPWLGGRDNNELLIHTRVDKFYVILHCFEILGVDLTISFCALLEEHMEFERLTLIQTEKVPMRCADEEEAVKPRLVGLVPPHHRIHRSLTASLPGTSWSGQNCD
ncbi:hypothetical protein RRG08_019671, partial [Elysia crispata]